MPTGFKIALVHALGEEITRANGHCEITPDYVRCCEEVLGKVVVRRWKSATTGKMRNNKLLQLYANLVGPTGVE